MVIYHFERAILKMIFGYFNFHSVGKIIKIIFQLKIQDIKTNFQNIRTFKILIESRNVTTVVIQRETYIFQPS